MTRAELIIVGLAAGSRRWRSPRAPAQATQGDRLLLDLVSTTQAGGHPDLTTTFTLATLRRPRSPGTSSSTCRRASSATPARSPSAPRPTSPSTAARPDSQVGLITVRGDLDAGTRTPARDGAALQPRPAGADETARFAFIVPDARHPDQRSRSRSAPAPTTACASPSGHHPADFPLADSRDDLLGLPGRADAHDAAALPDGTPGNPAGCPGLADTSCITAPTGAGDPAQPADRQPDRLHRRGAGQRRSRSSTYQDPANPSPGPTSTTRRSPAARSRPSTRSLHARPTTNETDSPVGPRPRTRQRRSSSASPPRPRRSARDRRSCPEASRSTPTPPTGRAPAPTPQANFGTEAPRQLPRQLQDRDLQRSARRRSTAPLIGSIYIGEPQAGQPVPAAS